MKRRVVHFNQLKLFHGTSNKNQGCVVGKTEPSRASRPSSMKESDGPVVIFLEDDFFPRKNAGTSPEDPGTVQLSCQA